MNTVFHRPAERVEELEAVVRLPRLVVTGVGGAGGRGGAVTPTGGRGAVNCQVVDRTQARPAIIVLYLRGMVSTTGFYTSWFKYRSPVCVHMGEDGDEAALHHGDVVRLLGCEAVQHRALLPRGQPLAAQHLRSAVQDRVGQEGALPPPAGLPWSPDSSPPRC